MTNQEFVDQLYQSLLGRPPDGEGGKFWLNALEAGLYTQTTIIRHFTAAPEVRKKLTDRVRDAYTNILGRLPDQSGLDWWVNQLTSGNVFPSLEYIEAQFRGSQEYADNGGVDRIYGVDTPVETRDGRTIAEPHPDAVGDGTNDNPTAMPDTEGATGTPPPATSTPGAPSPIDTYNRENVKAQIDMILSRYGLTGLSGWINEMLDNKAPLSQIQIELQDQQAFKDRFPALEMMRNAGMPVLSAEQYLQYEMSARAIMRSAALPEGFYDNPADFTNLIANGVSVSELSDRVQNVYLRSIQAPPEVRARYAAMFGVNGEAALAAQILDPDAALPVLERQIATAEIAGFGDVFGVNIQQARASRLAEIGYDGRSASQGFRQVAAQQSLFEETITETEDLTAEGEGVDAAFGLNQDSADTIERRRASRTNVLAGGGGLTIGQEGLAGRADQ